MHPEHAQEASMQEQNQAAARTYLTAMPFFERSRIHPKRVQNACRTCLGHAQTLPWS